MERFTDAGLGPFGDKSGEGRGGVVVDLVFKGSLNRERALSPREVLGLSTLSMVLASLFFVLSVDLSGVDFFVVNAMRDSTMIMLANYSKLKSNIHRG